MRDPEKMHCCNGTIQMGVQAGGGVFVGNFFCAMLTFDIELGCVWGGSAEWK